MLKILAATQIEFGTVVSGVYSEPLRTVHDGKLGGAYDVLIYIKNDDTTKYYTDVLVEPVSSTYDDIASEWGETGFGLKLLYGERQPTETEWDQVKSGEAIYLPDIGDSLSADTGNYYPVWVRSICPGKTSAQIKTNVSVKVTCLTKQVGS
jgi:hypothetical protein